MDLRSAFVKEQWDAENDQIGNHSVLRYELRTPRATTERVAIVLDRCIVHLSAESSFHAGIAEILLDAAMNHIYEAQRLLAVTETNYAPYAKFTRSVFIPPEAGLFDHFSEPLRSCMFLAVPSYASEFANGMSIKDFRHQIGRKDGWRVNVYRWDRLEKIKPSWP